MPTKFLLGIDEKILNFFSITMQNKFFDSIMPFFTSLTNRGEVWIFIAIVFIVYGTLKDKEKRKTGFGILLALIITGALIDYILKPLVGRTRPINIEHYKFLVSIPKSYSFPSGHTAASFAASGVIFFRKEKFRCLYLLLAAIIAFSRMYLHVHYPSDVLGGIVVSLICAKISVKIIEKFLK